MGLLSTEFSMKDLGPLSYFLGVSVTRDVHGLFLSQSQYARDILSRAKMSDCNPVRTPVDTAGKLGSTDGDLLSDPTHYRSLAGALQYLTFTRPDISYAVQQVCMHMHAPRSSHLNALKRILRYIKGTVTMVTTYYHGLLNVRLLSPDPAQKPSTVVLPMSLPNHVGFAIFFSNSVKMGHFWVLHVPSRYQVADIFTKGLPRVLFEDFRSSLSIREPPP
ncbi:hypothetical protein E3N88_17334 [Mikania micrantha]|uniref:Reverse transcriptase Ty1/copia-type domain-containing protein n=1 Tax=Mikania micrantha TaxID=192012 RepID=A0A5N6NUB3_9ASTR|nr:hypothetical protein E3N88_17334 [Mikania micrantha]